MRHLILTVDYEIFGNGTGDVRQHIVEPAEQMAKVCEKHGVPLTVFFEAEEYLAFVLHAAQLKKDLGYDPAELIRGQISSFIQRGHDVQLHLHPEWHGARYIDGRWLLRPEKTTVDSLFETQAEVTEYIASRKSLIEAMDVASSHKVRAYRAGAFSAQPGKKLLTALAENEIIIDTSVVKGLRSELEGLDYRQAPCAKGPWRVRDDVAREDESGLVWEFPIYSVMGRRIHQLTPTRLRAKFSRNVPKEKQRDTVKQLGLRKNGLGGLVKFLWNPVPIKMDYHNVPANRLVRWIREAPAPRHGEPDVVVLIGHTKEHITNAEIDRLCVSVKADKNWDIFSLADLARLLEKDAKHLFNH
jgi:hypothetical protein